MDAAVLLAAFAAANALFPGRGYPDEAHLVRLGAVIVPVVIGLFAAQGLYRRRYLLGGTQEYSRLATACTYGVVAFIAASYFAGGSPLVSRSSLLVFWVLSMLFTGVGRFTLRRVAYRLRRRGLFVTRVLIAGVDAHAAAIARQLDAPRTGGTEVAGFVDDFLPEGTVVLSGADSSEAGGRSLRVLGPARRAEEIALGLGADLIVVNQHPLAWETFQTLISGHGRGPGRGEIRLLPLPYDVVAATVETAPVGHVPLLRLGQGRITGVDAALKRILDLSAAGTGLVLLAPLVAVCLGWAVIRGRGPLTTERVLGQGGSVVPLTLFTRETAPWLLRGWPALWQVIRGRLSVVGPRPRTSQEQQFGAWGGVVTSVRPGLTGPWRLIPPGGAPDAETELVQDLGYIRNYTIWQDLFLLWQSCRALLPLPGRGARPQVRRWQPEAAVLGEVALSGGGDPGSRRLADEGTG